MESDFMKNFLSSLTEKLGPKYLLASLENPRGHEVFVKRTVTEKGKCVCGCQDIHGAHHLCTIIFLESKLLLIHREGGKLEFEYCNPETTVDEIGRLIIDMKFGWD